MASIDRRPDGSYRARWREHPGGPQQSRSFRRKTDAEQWLVQVQHQLLTGAYVDPAAGRVTVEAYAEQWRLVQVHRPGTAVSAAQQLRLHVYPVIGHRPLAAVRPSDIQALVQRLSATLAPSTVAVVYGRVVAVFRAAVRDRLIVGSPCMDVRLPTRRPPAALEVLDTAQVLALADAVPARYRALIVTGAGTGLRPGELFGLGVDRVDFLRRVVRVDRQVVRTGAGIELGALKTPASYRTVPLPAAVADELAAHLARWPAHRDLGVIFTNERDGIVQQHPFAALWTTARQRAGLPAWATPHDLRHYYASLLIRSGASVKVIQTRLGHASAKTTLDTYAHLFPDEEDRTRAAVDEAFAGAAEDYLRTSTEHQ